MAVGGYHEFDHRAPVAGVMIVFASIEYPVGEPPTSVVIDGITYVRKDCAHDDEQAVRQGQEDVG